MRYTRVNHKTKARRRGRLSILSLRILLGLYLIMLVKIILLKFHSLDLGFLWGRLLAGLQQPGLLSRQLDTGNIIPFREISRSLHSINGHSIVNLLGNVVIFIPLGILLGLLFDHERMAGVRIWVCSLFLSLSLEIAQLLFMIGQFDVDDLLLNSLGGLLGYAICRAVVITFRCVSNETNM
ncbi:VanZ family protein [Paenibacillus sp. GSMTC-2017]|uniref:VanZ family protein n=1 Tax=Paenibacillus sp. GSMTC-2017 TaxID=2794350 RepID=UPI0018D68394|nr:VanZ family protein [Paenibacillus sp. GSMTC-2017]MBH5316376.1 VanZ family protein [Paenibacillus sp. GSMTC-2017]